LLRALLAHPNIASKEAIIRTYDHEVRGATVVKPLTGPHGGPSDAAVLKPLETQGWRGFVLSNGINPFHIEADPYLGAVSAVDEAIRNAVAVGADPDHLALLDNFCWGDPLRPETLGGLVEAARACHDAALHYRAPFISGKDSLNNEYIGADGKRHAIPGTLLISAIAIHPDVRRAVTLDLKAAGNRLYLLGDWQPALGGAHLTQVCDPAALPADLFHAPAWPEGAPALYRALHRAIHAGLVASLHDLSEGGLAVSAAEMAFAGGLGLRLALDALHPDFVIALFAETNGCLLAEVAPEKADAFEAALGGLPFRLLGEVTADGALTFTHGRSVLHLVG
jgi:phosphoribosylformylglycinamidine synthase